MKSPIDALDLRIRRTYKFLWNALVSLMKERDFESITVTDICEGAMVHCTTFYKHYEDKYGLLFHGMQDELNALFAAVDRRVEKDNKADNRTRHIAVLEYVQQHEDFYRLMLVGDGFGKFSTLLRNAIAERLERHRRHNGEHPSIPMALHAQIAAAAIVRMISWWLENDCPYAPAEMVQYVSDHLDLIK
jgi:AcrR family transcriptional regulator